MAYAVRWHGIERHKLNLSKKRIRRLTQEVALQHRYTISKTLIECHMPPMCDESLRLKLTRAGTCSRLTKHRTNSHAPGAPSMPSAVGAASAARDELQQSTRLSAIREVLRWKELPTEKWYQTIARTQVSTSESQLGRNKPLVALVQD